MRSPVRTVALVIVLVSTAFAWSEAGADTKKPAAPAPSSAPAGKRHDANNVSALSESMEAVVQGAQKFVDKDVEGAIQLFRKAVKLQPRNAIAQYSLGEALLSQNKLEEAEGPLTAADDASGPSSPAKARILFVLASDKERLHKWDDAKDLWRRYAELGQGRADAGVWPESAAERLKVVEAWAKLDAAYAVVRSRIAGDGGAAPAPASPTAPAPAADGGK